MGFVTQDRLSDSPFVESIAHGWSVGNGTVIRPAESNWHIVFSKYRGQKYTYVVGPLQTSGIVTFSEGAETLWIKFKLGSFMPHIPFKECTDVETLLPQAGSNSFWLKGSAWQFPDFENADTFLNRMARQGILTADPVIHNSLQDRPQDIADRTVRNRFLRATGLTRNQILQIQRAQRAADLLRQGLPILDTVCETGYFDQPHLTRSLKQWVGHTPAQLAALAKAS